jgi:hypothetical protein
MPTLLAACSKAEICSVDGASVTATRVQLRADSRVAVRVETAAGCSEVVKNMGRCEVMTSSCKWVETLGVVTTPVRQYLVVRNKFVFATFHT